ncbi:hypothetical protein D3C72_1801920 [compost metagenome]
MKKPDFLRLDYGLRVESGDMTVIIQSNEKGEVHVVGFDKKNAETFCDETIKRR